MQTRWVTKFAANILRKRLRAGCELHYTGNRVTTSRRVSSLQCSDLRPFSSQPSGPPAPLAGGFRPDTSGACAVGGCTGPHRGGRVVPTGRHLAVAVLVRTPVLRGRRCPGRIRSTRCRPSADRRANAATALRETELRARLRDPHRHQPSGPESSGPESGTPRSHLSAALEPTRELSLQRAAFAARDVRAPGLPEPARRELVLHHLGLRLSPRWPALPPLRLRPARREPDLHDLRRPDLRRPDLRTPGLRGHERPGLRRIGVRTPSRGGPERLDLRAPGRREPRLRWTARRARVRPGSLPTNRALPRRPRPGARTAPRSCAPPRGDQPGAAREGLVCAGHSCEPTSTAAAGPDRGRAVSPLRSSAERRRRCCTTRPDLDLPAVPRTGRTATDDSDAGQAAR